MLSRKHTNNRRTTKKRAKTIANIHGHNRKERKACRGMGLHLAVLKRFVNFPHVRSRSETVMT